MCHHSKEKRSVVSCLQFHVTNLCISKCEKLVKTKEKLKSTHRYRKVPFSGVHTDTLQYCFKKSTLENVFEKLRFRKSFSS